MNNQSNSYKQPVLKKKSQNPPLKGNRRWLMRVRMSSVYCILEVKYCITGVNVYMEMNFVDKTWLIFHTWQHFSALLI